MVLLNLFDELRRRGSRYHHVTGLKQGRLVRNNGIAMRSRLANQTSALKAM